MAHGGETPIGYQIDRHREQILFSLERHKILIVLGQTGESISVRLAHILFQTGIYNQPKEVANFYRQNVICVTSPRRVATIQLASRCAQDLGCQLGSTVGYSVRFKEAHSREQTCIKFALDSSLAGELLSDPLLMKYSVIIVDDIHERNIFTDLLLGLLKCILNKRSDLKVILCSATTHNVDQLIDFYKPHHGDTNKHLAILSVQAKIHPLNILYLERPVANYLDSAVETAINIHETQRLASGKILIFLTSKEEVDVVCGRLVEYSHGSSSRLDLKKLLVLPFHSSLRPEQISKVFDEHGRNTRVCIVSTNIAESSTVIIDDICHVIDCGFTRWKIFDHQTGVDKLEKVPISKSLADQRAAQAGKTREGNVFRLYPVHEYRAFEEYTGPEIERSSLAQVCLLLKSLGVVNLLGFPLLSPLPRQNLIVALELLYLLDAVDISGEITHAGRLMASFDLDPKLSKILTSQESSKCIEEACKIVAMLQPRDIFLKTSKHSIDFWNNHSLSNICTTEGDMISYLNVINGFLNSQKSYKWAEKRNLNHQALLTVVDIYEFLMIQLKRHGVNITSAGNRVDLIQKSVLSGLFINAAYLHPSDDYKTVKGELTVHAHPTSVYSNLLDKPKFVIFLELLDSTKLFMRHIMSIEKQWLLQSAPDYYVFANELEIDRIRRP